MRLHLVDGTFELFRSHFSPRPGRRDRAGQDVKASVGVLDALIALLDDPDEAVTHLAVAFDNPIESWRNDRFAGYKDGSGVDPDLLAQFDLVEEAVAALGVTVWSMDRFEADDALATGAVAFADAVDQVRILTPDKDLGQVVRGTAVVQVDRMRRREFDEAGVAERLGVTPTLVPDYLALVGDSADGIPGLPGFGAKTAGTLLRGLGGLEALREATEWPAVRGQARLRATLSERFDDALLYRELATLVTDVPLAETLDDLAWEGADRGAWERVCDRLDATTLRGRPRAWRP